jgi:hypothetical protein
MEFLKGETFTVGKLSFSFKRNNTQAVQAADKPENNAEEFTPFGFIFAISILAVIGISIFLAIKLLSINVLLKVLIGFAAGFLTDCGIYKIIDMFTGDINNFIYKKESDYVNLSMDTQSERTEELREKVFKESLIVNYVRIDDAGTLYKQISGRLTTADATLDRVSEDIRTRLAYAPVWKKMFFGSILGFIGLTLILGISKPPEPIYTIVLIIGFLLAVAGVCMTPFQFFKDKKRRTAYLVYDVVYAKESAIQAFYDAFFKLNESIVLSVVTDTHTDIYARNNAGATSAFSSQAVSICNSPPKNIKTNAFIPVIAAGTQYYCFFPDHILYIRDGAVYAIPYADAEIRVSNAFVPTEGSIPSDGIQAGSTWKYVNNDGSPDMRSKSHNYAIPLIKYCRISIQAHSVPLLEIMVSNYAIGMSFANSFMRYTA